MFELQNFDRKRFFLVKTGVGRWIREERWCKSLTLTSLPHVVRKLPNFLRILKTRFDCIVI